MRSLLKKLGALSLTAALVLGVSSAQAQAITQSKTYLQSKSGNIIKSGSSNNCVQRQNWDSEAARPIEGCAGVILAVTAPDAVMFEFDSAQLTPAGKAAIDKQRQKLQAKMDKGFSGVIVGHTDSLGDPQYNIWLSERRAVAVRDYLLGESKASAKVAVVGQGGKDPIATNGTREGRQINRRVEFVFVEEGS